MGRQDDLLQISHEASPELSAQVLHYVGEYRRRVPQGPFKENDDFSASRLSAILKLKNIDDLERGNFASSPREAQLQSSGQNSPQESDDPRRRARRRSSQCILYLYSDFMKVEFQRTLGQERGRQRQLYTIW